MIQIEPSWRKLLARLEADRSWQTVFVIGPIDAGKTTVCRFLGRKLAERASTAAVDCDPGQSALGPPGSLALAREPWEGGSPLALRFVGSTTPARHLLQTLTGVKRLADRAFEVGADKVVFDSSGYGATEALREFHFQTLDVLEPDHLVALQRRRELESLLANFERRQKPRIHRLPISGAAVRRDAQQRRSYRRKRFGQYFRAAAPQRLPLTGLGLHGMIPALDEPDRYRNRLVGLCDKRGFAIVMGILLEVDLDGAQLGLYAPPFERERIASVQFGSIRLDRSGREL